MNKGIKEVASGGLGSGIGVLIVVVGEQFAGVEWSGINDVLIVMACQAIWGYIRPYIPKPEGDNV